LVLLAFFLLLLLFKGYHGIKRVEKRLRGETFSSSSFPGLVGTFFI
jgi:hypothetical protein